jgi:hypothetical protein
MGQNLTSPSRNSANFAFWGFSEVQLPLYGVLGSSAYSTPPVPSLDGPPKRGSGHGAQPSPIRYPSALVLLPRAPYCPSRSGPHLFPRQPLRSAGRDTARLSSDASRRPYLPPARSSQLLVEDVLRLLPELFDRCGVANIVGGITWRNRHHVQLLVGALSHIDGGSAGQLRVPGAVGGQQDRGREDAHLLASFIRR